MDDRCIPEVCKSNLPQLKRNARVRFVSLSALQPFPCLHKLPLVTSAQGIFAHYHYRRQEKGWDCSKKQQFYGRGSCLQAVRAASTELNGLEWTWHRTEGRTTLQAGLASENFNVHISQTKFYHRWLWIFCVAQRGFQEEWEYPLGISLCLSSPKEDFTTPHIPDLQPEFISCSLGSTQTTPGGAEFTHSHTEKAK